MWAEVLLNLTTLEHKSPIQTQVLLWHPSTLDWKMITEPTTVSIFISAPEIGRSNWWTTSEFSLQTLVEETWVSNSTGALLNSVDKTDNLAAQFRRPGDPRNPGAPRSSIQCQLLKCTCVCTFYVESQWLSNKIFYMQAMKYCTFPPPPHPLLET